MIVYVHTRARSLVSIGYEGKTIVDLLDSLVAQRVEVLVDVRLTPLSRKPGLSKTRLANALASVGIGYVHHRALGNPKDNRDGFRAGDPASIQRYHEVLSGEAAGAAIEHVAALSAAQIVPGVIADDGVVAGAADTTLTPEEQQALAAARTGKRNA